METSSQAENMAGFVSESSANPKRAAIVDAATQLFLSEGFGTVSMDAIAARANVSKRTIYSHFDDKATLFGAVIVGVCQVLGRDECPVDCTAAIPQAPPEEILPKAGRIFLKAITSELAVRLSRVVVAESERFPELGRIFYDTGPAYLFANMETYLADQVAKGRLRIDDPAAAAQQFFAMVAEPLKMQMSFGIVDTVEDAKVEKVVQSCVRLFLAGYGAKDG